MNLKKYFVYIFKLIWRKLQPFGAEAPGLRREIVGLQAGPVGVAGRTMWAGSTQRSKSAALT